jgi:hypothetical protein
VRGFGQLTTLVGRGQIGVAAVLNPGRPVRLMATTRRRFNPAIATANHPRRRSSEAYDDVNDASGIEPSHSLLNDGQLQRIVPRGLERAGEVCGLTLEPHISES